jgi:acetyl esterase/lipase
MKFFCCQMERMNAMPAFTADPEKRDPREIPLNTDYIKTKWRNLPYVDGTPHERQVLDLYHPNGKTGPFPVIVCIYGGGFRSGDKTYGEFKGVVKALDYGYAVASINYRYSQQAHHPAQIHDVKAAIRFLKEHAEKYGLLKEKMALWGGSAGATLASLAGTTADMDLLTDRSMGNAGESEAVQAVVDWYGPIDFSKTAEQFKEPGVYPQRAAFAADPNALSRQLFGCTDAELPEKQKEFNAARYISDKTPPFLIQHGTKDDLVPLAQAQNFARALVEKIGPERVKLDILEGAGHGGEAFGTPENLARIIRFLDRYLK